MRSVESSAGSGLARTGDATATCTVLIPAFNEAETVAHVVEVAKRANLGSVLVVDDGSRDDTGVRAREHGARVLRLASNVGKGGAVARGLEHVTSEVVLLLDADLVGLEPHHLELLAGPVMRGEADMTRGFFVGGRWRTATAQRLTPQLNGQRAVRRDLLARVPKLESTRYGIEVAITETARREGWRSLEVALEGVSQVMKEEKRGLVAGLFTRLRMYRDILATLLGRRGRAD